MKKYSTAASAEKQYQQSQSCDVDLENFNLGLNSLDLPQLFLQSLNAKNLNKGGVEQRVSCCPIVSSQEQFLSIEPGLEFQPPEESYHLL